MKQDELERDSSTRTQKSTWNDLVTNSIKRVHEHRQ
jgi:hypothetical protein